MKIQYTGSSKVIKRICEILNGKVDAVTGKGLSENDFTDEQCSKLAGLENYTHPAYTAYASGWYKVEIDALGHVSTVAAVGKSDITALGIPEKDTTYSNATQSSAGLMSAADKKKLDGIAAGANKTVVDTALSSTSTNPVQNKAICSADGVSELINQLTTGTATPKDADYYVCQFSGGGTSTTTYHRRPMSALWAYIKTKASGVFLPIDGNASTATKLKNARKINGVAFDGSKDITIPRSMLYMHYALGTTGSNGWVKVAQLKITAAYVNSPIEISYTRREAMPVRLTIRFKNSGKTDPDLSRFVYETVGDEFCSAAVVKSATSTWDLYIKKTESYDSISVVDCKYPENASATLITWTDTQVSSLPSGYILATPYDDSGWKSCTLGSFAASGTIQYRIIGKHIYVQGTNVKLKTNVAISPNAPQTLAVCAQSFANIKQAWGVGRFGSYMALITMEQYSGDNIVSIYGVSAAIPAGTIGNFSIHGLLD